MTDTSKRNEGIAYAIITEPNDHLGVQRITEALNTKDAEHAKEIAAYGGCKNCFGKGYNTVLSFMIGRRYRKQNPIMVYCKCERGITLEREVAKDKDAAVAEASRITEDTSDGYHTFKELYDFRLLYNAHLFNEWAAQGKYGVHKSQRHNDGELCFGRNDYFIVVATLPTGQISNHYPMSDWELFKCQAVPQAKEVWDGHTSRDVAKRLRDALTTPPKQTQHDDTK